MLTDWDFSASFSGDEEREIVVIVAVAVANSAAVEDH